MLTKIFTISLHNKNTGVLKKKECRYSGIIVTNDKLFRPESKDYNYQRQSRLNLSFIKIKDHHCMNKKENLVLRN